MTPFENEIDQLLTQAEALLQDEKPMEALALLDRARKIEPRHAWMLLFRGVALGQLGRVEEATEQLLAVADENRDDIDVQVDVSRHLLSLDQHQDALIYAERAIVLDDNDAGAHAACAESLERLGRIAVAIPHRELALELDPEDIDSRYYLAVDYCDTERYAEAFEVAEPLIEELPTDPDIVRLHGACLSYLGNHQEALARWAELERLEGLTPNLLHNRASTLDVLGRHDEALATINEAIEIDPDIGLNYYTRGMINEHLNDDAAAIEDYLAVLARDPEHLDAVINLVELAATVDAVPTVIDHLSRLMEFSPESSKLHYAYGRLLMEIGEISRGMRAIEESVNREPSMGVGWYTLTMLYGMSGDFAGTVTASDQALRYFPDDPGLWFNRGLALHDLHRYPEAMESYDRALTLAPDDPLPWLQLGRLLLLDLNRPADARGVLKEALTLQPGNQGAAWMLALCYLRLQKPEDAAFVLRDLLDNEPDHMWGRLVRAALHAQREDFDNAFEDLQIAALQGYDTRLLLNESLFEPLWMDERFDKILQETPAEVEQPAVENAP